MARPTVTQTNGFFPRASLNNPQTAEDLVTQHDEHSTALDSAEAARFGTPSIAVAVEAAGHIDVTVTLKDGAGNALAAPAMATMWLSDTAGAAPSAGAPTTLAIQTGVELKQDTSKVLFRAVCNASGVIVYRVTGTATTWYLNVAVGNTVTSSAAIVLA